MKELTIKSASKLPDLIEVEKFELENKIKLPLGFTNFLLKKNPIEVEESRFLTKDTYKEIALFYPFDKDCTLSFQKIFHNLNEIMFEGKYVAFAGDEGGWKFIISVQDSDYGKVYFCRMDEELEDALTLLADSFEEFINGLQKPEEVA